MDELVTNPAPPRVGIIGAGRLGRTLARASTRAGLVIVAGWSRGLVDRQRFADQLEVPVAASFDDAVRGVDVVFVAVPDDQLAGVLDELAARIDRSTPPLVVLTSGSASIELGAPVEAAGARIVRIHPLQGVTEHSPAHALDGAVAAVTSRDEQSRTLAWLLAAQLRMRPFDLADEHAATYHAAGAIAAGGVTTLVAIARDLAIAAGMEPDAALRAMAALATSAITRAVEETPERALTGPVVRGDATTVAAHVEAVSSHGSVIASVYAELTRATIELATAAGRIDPVASERLADALGAAAVTT